MTPGPTRARGLSLIETLVVAAISALVVMLTAPQFATLTRDNRVRSIADEYAGGLTLAKQEAVARNTRVQFQPSGTGWRIAQLASDGTVAAILVSRTGLNTEALYSITASATQFVFNGAGRPTAPGPTTYSVDVGLVGGTCRTAGGEVRCLRITVTSGGAVKSCDPAAASTDPRTCS